MVYVFVAGVWISGTVKRFLDEMVEVVLVTGATVVRLKTEVLTESPRLSDNSVWPV
jgi:hypothetical protein